MALTELQKTRVRFHLGYSSAGQGQFMDRLTVNNLSPENELQLVGSTFDYEFLGTPLAESGSALANCELAWANLSPTVIDDSLQVSQVNKVSLRGNELTKRTELYEYHCDRLAQITNSPKLRSNSHGRHNYAR